MATIAEESQQLCQTDIAEYLQGVKFKKKGDDGPGVDFCDFDSEGKLRERLFSDKAFIHNFDEAKKEIKQAVKAQCVKASTAGKSGWIQCEGKCYDILHKYAVKELESTAFILRLFAKSMIDIENPKKKEVTVIYEGSDDFREITGKWMRKKGWVKKKRVAQDLKYFTIDIAQENPRLIMALGPSSAGKTFSSETVMKMIKNADTKFPTKFLSIDGGIYREESMVYQTILDSMCKDVIGFADLVSPGAWEEMKHGTIFSAGTAKKEIAAWLKSKGIKISLYIPETLGAPDTVASRPFDKIKKYIKITGDSNWIGLLIWQHLNDAEISKKKKNKIGKWKVMCDFPEEQKCKGTVPLGRNREKGEGKIYSPGAWLNSMKNGEKMLKKARGLRVDLHNSGQKAHKSTIKEYPLDDGSYVFNKAVAASNNMVYERAGELPVIEEIGPETEAEVAEYVSPEEDASISYGIKVWGNRPLHAESMPVASATPVKIAAAAAGGRRKTRKRRKKKKTRRRRKKKRKKTKKRRRKKKRTKRKR